MTSPAICLAETTYLITPAQLVILPIFDSVVCVEKLDHTVLPNCSKRTAWSAVMIPHESGRCSPYCKCGRALLQGNGTPDLRKPIIKHSYVVPLGSWCWSHAIKLRLC